MSVSAATTPTAWLTTSRTAALSRAAGERGKFSIGPKVVYWLGPAAAVVAQWHHEFISENDTRGDLFWSECALPF